LEQRIDSNGAREVLSRSSLRRLRAASFDLHLVTPFGAEEDARAAALGLDASVVTTC
jgi:hypothetical protein